MIAASTYGYAVKPGMDASTAVGGVDATTLWHLRVLAGWLPPSGTQMVRLVAARYEIANIEGLLEQLDGGRAAPAPFELGALAVVWPAVRNAGSISEVRRGASRLTLGRPR